MCWALLSTLPTFFFTLFHSRFRGEETSFVNLSNFLRDTRNYNLWMILSWENAICSACLPRPLRLKWDYVYKNTLFKWQSTMCIFICTSTSFGSEQLWEHFSATIKSINSNQIRGLGWSQSPRLSDYCTGSIFLPLLKQLSIFSTISPFTNVYGGWYQNAQKDKKSSFIPMQKSPNVHSSTIYNSQVLEAT